MPRTNLADACVGDCDGDAAVTVDELVTGTMLGLGQSEAERCPSFDGNLDASVTVDELAVGIGAALDGCGIATACGDPAVSARWTACRISDTRDECESAGGTWGVYPFSRREGCFCPTGDGGCACNSARDCLGRCYASGSLCRSLHEGTCSAYEPQAGCWCEFPSTEGEAFPFCNDP